MSDAKLDLDECQRVANAAEEAIAALGNPAAKPSRREFSDGIEATKKFSKTFDPPTVKLLIADSRERDKLKALMLGTQQERQGLKDERDQLKARVAELEEDSKRTWGLHTEEESRRYNAEFEQDKLRTALEAKVAQVEAWRDVANIGHHLLSHDASGEFTYVRYETAWEKAQALDIEAAASKTVTKYQCSTPRYDCEGKQHGHESTE